MIPEINPNTGCLPDGCYDCLINDIKERFVDDFPESISRESRFKGFVRYSKYFFQNVKSTRKQLINGSFTTNKINPNDVDFVIVINVIDISSTESDFIENEIEDELQRKIEYQEMKKEVEMGRADINDLFCCDSYILFRREPDDKLYEDYLEDREYWIDCWGHSRKDKKTSEKHPKGIISLEYNSKTFEGI